jgi:hypothetical protein
MIIERSLSSSGQKNTPEFIELHERRWMAPIFRWRKALIARELPNPRSSVLMKTRIATAVLMFASAIASAQSIVPCEIVVPVLDSNHNVVAASAPDGHTYPVFQIAPQSKLVDGIRHALETSFAQETLRLDRYARNLILAKRTQAHVVENEEWLTFPMYLLMSTEEGGFARFGFWLQDSAGKRRLVLAGYVDLVITDDLVCSRHILTSER